jgi:hypothetical protein
MPSAIFQLVALLIAVLGLATAAFPRQMSRWRMRGPGGTAQVEPGETRLLVTRLLGVVVALIAILMAFGSPATSL